MSVTVDPSDDVAWLTVADWHERLACGAATAHDLTETLLRRIDEIDRRGPALHSIIAVAADAAAQAQRCDDERQRGVDSGPLAGVPVIVKDNIDTAGGLATTAGSLALEGHHPDDDAEVVRRLRAAGAIVLAKANLSEWANFRGHPSTSGWSALGGQCLNPHNLRRSPGGSSAGSAAAVAAGLTPLALGSETDGSILVPAAFNGVVGIKPTVGLVSHRGLIPVAPSQDAIGPLARSVLDAALLLSVIAGEDGAESAATGLVRPADLNTNYVAHCRLDGLRGTRIAVGRGPFCDCGPRTDAVMTVALAAMAEAGAELVDPESVDTAIALRESSAEFDLLLAEFRQGIDAYLGRRPASVGAPASLAELVEFNEANHDRELALFGQEILLSALSAPALDDERHLATRERLVRLSRIDGLDRLFERSGAQLLAMPTIGPAWLIDAINGDPDAVYGASIAAVAGYPSMTLPIGLVAGLPVGLCLIGRAFSEATMIAAAYALEQTLALGAQLRPDLVALAASD